VSTRRSLARLSAADALLDPVTEILFHIAEILEGAFQDGFGHAVEQVADDIGDQPVPFGVVRSASQAPRSWARTVVFLSAWIRLLSTSF
jgi:hypothetical protein